MLNRLTANFSCLIQEPARLRLQSSQSFFAMLEGAISAMTRSTIRTNLRISLPNPLLDTFLQFEYVLDSQASFMPVLPVEPAIRQTEEPRGENGVGLWLEVTAGLTSLILDVLNPLDRALTQLMAFQSVRGNAGSDQPFVLIDRILGINLPIPPQSELRILSDHRFTEHLTQSDHGFVEHLTRSDHGFVERLTRSEQSFSQSITVIVDRLVQSISQFARIEIETLRLPLVLPSNLRTTMERFTAIPSNRFIAAQPILQSNWGDIAVNSTISSPIVLHLQEAQYPEFNPPEPSITSFVVTEVSQSPATNLIPPPRAEPLSGQTLTPITFNGGIHVQITAQNIDREHADETARLIAGQVLQEITRLTEQDRFLRGFPPFPLR
jgi:hypothetical protein